LTGIGARPEQEKPGGRGETTPARRACHRDIPGRKVLTSAVPAVSGMRRHSANH
jgi:hypothetical protein